MLGWCLDGPLAKYVKLRVAYALGMSGTFPRHLPHRKACATMHVGITSPRRRRNNFFVLIRFLQFLIYMRAPCVNAIRYTMEIFLPNLHEKSVICVYIEPYDAELYAERLFNFSNGEYGRIPHLCCLTLVCVLRTVRDGYMARVSTGLKHYVPKTAYTTWSESEVWFTITIWNVASF